MYVCMYVCMCVCVCVCVCVCMYVCIYIYIYTHTRNISTLNISHFAFHIPTLNILTRLTVGVNRATELVKHGQDTKTQD